MYKQGYWFEPKLNLTYLQHQQLYRVIIETFLKNDQGSQHLVNNHLYSLSDLIYLLEHWKSFRTISQCLSRHPFNVCTASVMCFEFPIVMKCNENSQPSQWRAKLQYLLYLAAWTKLNQMKEKTYLRSESLFRRGVCEYKVLWPRPGRRLNHLKYHWN